MFCFKKEYLPFLNRDNLKLSNILNLGLYVRKVFEFTLCRCNLHFYTSLHLFLKVSHGKVGSTERFEKKVYGGVLKYFSVSFKYLSARYVCVRYVS